MHNVPSSHPQTEILEVASEQVGQRIDNFLFKHMKGVPKSRIYRALRGGEVRVNSGRKKPLYKLCAGDRLRIPPLRQSEKKPPLFLPAGTTKIVRLFEDDHLLVVNKPTGLAVHGGTGLDYGLIEVERTLCEEKSYLELVHRLDRETSGCLMLAKSRKALLGLQEQLKARKVEKNYVALVKGTWRGDAREIDAPVVPSKRNKGAHTEMPHGRSIFSPIQRFKECTLVNIRLITGRMHQARIHAAHIAQPIAGDWRYGDLDFNRMVRKMGLMRLFLHAERLGFCHPLTEQPITVHATLPAPLQQVLDNLSG